MHFVGWVFLSLIVFWTLMLYAKRSLLPPLWSLGGIFCSWREGQAALGWVLGTGDSWLGGRSEKMRGEYGNSETFEE